MTDARDSDGPVRPAPQGARANAVPPPAAWTPLVEVDHRVAQPLLDSLEDAGVAAYAEPRAHATATDRIHVDATRRDLAEAVVEAELPGLLADLDDQDDVDPFDAIVAAWDSVPESPTWPEAEDVRPPRKVAPDHTDREPPARPRRNPEDEHFVPPPAPPVKLPRKPSTRYAVLALVLGIVTLVVLPLLGRTPSNGVQALGAVSVVAGLATLIFTMRDGPSVDDGPDDGAVV